MTKPFLVFSDVGVFENWLRLLDEWVRHLEPLRLGSRWDEKSFGP